MISLKSVQRLNIFAFDGKRLPFLLKLKLENIFQFALCQLCCNLTTFSFPFLSFRFFFLFSNEIMKYFRHTFAPNHHLKYYVTNCNCQAIYRIHFRSMKWHRIKFNVFLRFLVFGFSFLARICQSASFAPFPKACSFYQERVDFFFRCGPRNNRLPIKQKASDDHPENEVHTVNRIRQV